MILTLCKQFWAYLGETQTKWVRILHLTLACLIILQIINSNFMAISYSRKLLNWGTWVHIVFGITITLTSILFIAIILKKRGIKYFYPYFYGEFSQVKVDLKMLYSLKLPHAAPFGIATVIQGLGLGALVLVMVSGLSWFMSWLLQWGIAPDIQSLHKMLTGLIEVYIVGHGCLGVLHFILRRYAPQYLEQPE